MDFPSLIFDIFHSLVRSLLFTGIVTYQSVLELMAARKTALPQRMGESCKKRSTVPPSKRENLFPVPLLLTWVTMSVNSSCSGQRELGSICTASCWGLFRNEGSDS